MPIDISPTTEAEPVGVLRHGDPQRPMDVARRCIDDVLVFTGEMLPGRTTVDTRSDPEYPDEQWLVVTVRVSGEPAELVARRRQWHRRLAEVAPDCVGTIRLSICPTP